MAYLNSMLKHVIYMKPPEGAKVLKGKAYQVVKGLYGLKQSGREWNMEFDKFLQCSNFHRLDCVPCIYTRGKGDNFAVVVIYVDDTLIIAPNLETVKCIKEEIVPETAASIAEQKEYPQIVGKLLWLSNGTCPDISQAVGILARYMTQPSREHYNAVQKVLQYLNHTRDIHLQYGSNKQQDFLMAHSDANWASDATAQCKSSSGSAVFVCGNLVAWKAIGIDVGIPTIFSDNTGTIQVSKDPAQHWKLKHIDTKYHFIRDNVQDGKVKIKYINTADNLADIFTKPVGKDALQHARQGLGLKTQQAAAAQQSPALPLRETVEGDTTK
ncbi:uncharacterized protein UHOD_11665 [Ustilago sp. UG-2017b]|nr:uncharacterized protein UHOD_11665 [Ustilago sp. UG-2017b]